MNAIQIGLRSVSAESAPPGEFIDLPGRGRTFAVDIAGPPGAPPSSLGLLARVIADAFLAARLRLGPGAVTGGVWAFSSASTSGRLLANTSGL